MFLILIFFSFLCLFSDSGINVNPQQTDGTGDGTKADTSVENMNISLLNTTEEESDPTRLVIAQLEMQKKENERLMREQQQRDLEMKQILDEKRRVEALRREIEQENDRLKKLKEDN